MSLPPRAEAGAILTRARSPWFIDVHRRRSRAMPRVIGDDIAGGALAARHLLDLGHTAIGFVGDAVEDPFGFTSSRDRERGLTQELATVGIGLPPEWIGHGAHGRYEARDLARRMRLADRRPTAIFAASDTQALGVIAAAHEIGLRVPDDLSVIGYDDVEAADYVALTTVSQRLFESGRSSRDPPRGDRASVRAAADREAFARGRGPSDHGTSRRAVDETHLRRATRWGFGQGGGGSWSASDGIGVPGQSCRRRGSRPWSSRASSSLRARHRARCPRQPPRRPPRRRPPRRRAQFGAIRQRCGHGPHLRD